MCGRFTLRTPATVLVEHFMLGASPDLVPRYNIAPTQLVPIVRPGDAQRELFAMRWGLIPFWAKDKRIGARMINARAETVATKSAFRSAFKKRRCLVPSDGYYEWITEGKQKVPFLIRKSDDEPFAMAGLWERWKSKEEPSSADNPSSGDADSDADKIIESFTIITTAANKETEDVHDRMPVILDPEDYDQWLDPDSYDIEGLQELLVPFESPLQVEPVNPIVNSVKNDVPECVDVQPRLF